jgi:uncharacterized protein YecT (DUF1311 family)
VTRSARWGSNPGSRTHPPRALIVLLLITLGAGSAARAADEPMSCENAASTADMRKCENARLERAEQEMKAAYAKLERSLGDAQRKKLRTAQAAWLKFREANADFYSSALGQATLAPLAATNYRADATEARTRELKKALER